MQRFRYDTSGEWLKGNTHVHSRLSDGGRTVTELAEMYSSAGYDFLCLADHWVASRAEEHRNPTPLILLDGIELDGTDTTGAYYHVVCLGKFSRFEPALGLEAAMQAAREQGGFIVLAHPHWTGNTIDDALRHRFDAIEAYNHVCQWLNGKGDSFVHWDLVMEKRPEVLSVAVDDAHVKPEHPGWNGGWIVVNVPERTPDAIMDAIRAGNFYSSCGPAFRSIECRDTAVIVRTTPVAFIRLVGPASHGARVGSFEGVLRNEMQFHVPPDWPTARIEIEDANGRRAWTNNLFIGS